MSGVKVRHIEVWAGEPGHTPPYRRQPPSDELRVIAAEVIEARAEQRASPLDEDEEVSDERD